MEAKEYVISIPKKKADLIWQVIWTVVDTAGEKQRLDEIPDKFSNAMLGLACRFNVKGRKRPVYKMTDEHLNGLLDVVGGFYCSMNDAKQKGYKEANTLYPVALDLLRWAFRVEAQAAKQGFKPQQESLPTPPKGRHLTLVH